jgi:hypothetical protein
MDLYLEGPSCSTVHANLVDEIARQFAVKVRPKSLALSCERVFEATPDPADFAGAQHRIPDVRDVAVDHGELKTSTEGITASIAVEALMDWANFVESGLSSWQETLIARNSICCEMASDFRPAGRYRPYRISCS